jgi:hypothetical protein
MHTYDTITGEETSAAGAEMSRQRFLTASLLASSARIASSTAAAGCLMAPSERDAAAGMNLFMVDAAAPGLARLRNVRRDPRERHLAEHAADADCSAKSPMAWQ